MPAILPLYHHLYIYIFYNLLKVQSKMIGSLSVVSQWLSHTVTVQLCISLDSNSTLVHKTCLASITIADHQKPSKEPAFWGFYHQHCWTLLAFCVFASDFSKHSSSQRLHRIHSTSRASSQCVWPCVCASVSPG